MDRVNDHVLREQHLVFYSQDVDEIDQELDGFLELSGSRSAMLVDRSGHMVTRRGASMDGNLESIAALAAGSFAATKEMARLVGEGEFDTLFHQGTRECIQISAIGERSLFIAVFDDHTNLGLVRFYAEESSARLKEIFLGITQRSAANSGASDLGDDFSSSASAALDKLF